MNKQVPVGRRAIPETDRLSGEDIRQLLDLLKGSNTIELKLMVQDTARSAVRRLGFDPVEAQPRQTFFFDTPDLALNKAGLIVRARRSAGDKGDTVIKIRPVDPQSISADLKRDESFKIEVDVMPGGYVCSASSKGRCTGAEVLEVADGQRPLRSLFSRAQRDFFTAHAPTGLTLKDLVPLGPTFLLRLKQQPKHYDRPVTVELWLYPDGSRVLEISTKGLPEEAFQLAAQFRAFLADCGIAVERSTDTKTAGALRYFSKQLQAKPRAA